MVSKKRTAFTHTATSRVENRGDKHQDLDVSTIYFQKIENNASFKLRQRRLNIRQNDIQVKELSNCNTLYS